MSLAPETADFKLNRLNWMSFLRLFLSIAPCGDPIMQEYFDFAMEHNELQKPENWQSASELHMKPKEIAQL